MVLVVRHPSGALAAQATDDPLVAAVRLYQAARGWASVSFVVVEGDDVRGVEWPERWEDAPADQ